MQYLTRQQVREVDRIAIQDYGIPGVVLMENAARGAVDVLLSEGVNGRVVICAGKGNNAGDGLVMARHLDILGVDVTVLLFCEPDVLSGDADINYRIIERSGIDIVCLPSPSAAAIAERLRGADWIVDALLGTGTRGELREPFESVIAAINDAGCRILAVDLPSGLDCDTGKQLGDCIRADVTVTFVAEKIGFENVEARQFTGKVEVVRIGVPREVVDSAATL